MAKVIRVNSKRLGTDSQKILDDIKRIKKNIEVLNTKVTELDSMWDGESSEAFKLSFHQDIARLGEEVKSLEELYRYENNAKSKYESADRKISDIVAKVRV